MKWNWIAPIVTKWEHFKKACSFWEIFLESLQRRIQEVHFKILFFKNVPALVYIFQTIFRMRCWNTENLSRQRSRRTELFSDWFSCTKMVKLLPSLLWSEEEEEHVNLTGYSLSAIHFTKLCFFLCSNVCQYISIVLIESYVLVNYHPFWMWCLQNSEEPDIWGQATV